MSDASEGSDGELDAKAARKAAKKAAKAEKRAKREGKVISGRKDCDLCSTSVDLLIRCQIDSAKQWKMVCGRCWNTPAVANGVVDGDSETNPHCEKPGGPQIHARRHSNPRPPPHPWQAWPPGEAADHMLTSG